MSATGGNKNPRRRGTLERAEEALRQHYERSFAVSLSAAPSVLWANPAQRAAPLAEARKRLEETERTILSRLGEPLDRKVAEPLRGTLASMPKPGASLAEQRVPRLRIEDPAAFEESTVGLCGWMRNQAPSAASPSGSETLGALVKLRALAEEGNAAEALERASQLYPRLSETNRRALAPFFSELSLIFLRAIEAELGQGETGKATALAERAKAIVEETPWRDDFNGLLRELFAPHAADPGQARPKPLVAAPAAEAQGSRVRQADALLREHADELSLAENQLEQGFLQAVRDGSEAAFRRKEKLRNRLLRRTRWGGREPYKTALRLLGPATECDA